VNEISLLGLMGRKRFFISKPNRFGSVRVVRFKHYKTGNRTGHFSKYSNRFHLFFFKVWFLQLIFFGFLD
jgi:hypothetical protein